MGATTSPSRLRKPNLGSHYGHAANPLSFQDAYTHVSKHPELEYETTGNATPFVAVAAIAQRGRHPGEKVIKFLTAGTERARAYACCWGHRTNCSKTHIDCYTEAIAA